MRSYYSSLIVEPALEMHEIPEAMHEREGDEIACNVRYKEQQKPPYKRGTATPPTCAYCECLTHSVSFSLLIARLSSGDRRSQIVELLSLRSGFVTLFSTLPCLSGRFTNPPFSPTQRAVGVGLDSLHVIRTGHAVDTAPSERISKHGLLCTWGLPVPWPWPEVRPCAVWPRPTAPTGARAG